MKKKIILELYGLPGSGKTTIVNDSLQIMSDKYRIYSLRDVYFYKERKYNTLLIYIKSIFYYENFSIIVNLMKCFKLASKQKLFDSLRLVKFRYQLLQFSKREDFEIIFLEEGIVQYLSSVAYQELLSPDEMRKLFKSSEVKSIDHYFINLSIDESSSLNRIRDRAILDKELANRRTDSLNDESALRVLGITKKNMDLVGNLLPENYKIVIKADNPVKNNVKKILTLVEEKLKD